MIKLPESAELVQEKTPEFLEYFPMPWKSETTSEFSDIEHIYDTNGNIVFQYLEDSEEKFRRVLALLNGDQATEKFEFVSLISHYGYFIQISDKLSKYPQRTLRFHPNAYWYLLGFMNERTQKAKHEAADLIKNELIIYCIEKLKK